MITLGQFGLVGLTAAERLPAASRDQKTQTAALGAISANGAVSLSAVNERSVGAF